MAGPKRSSLRRLMFGFALWWILLIAFGALAAFGLGLGVGPTVSNILVYWFVGHPLIVLAYGLYRRDWMFILGYLTGLISGIVWTVYQGMPLSM